MIVDSILRHVYGAAAEPRPGSRYELPANLRRFFTGKAAAARPAQPIPEAQPADAAQAVCCPPAEQQTCWNASAKRE